MRFTTSIYNINCFGEIDGDITSFDYDNLTAANEKAESLWEELKPKERPLKQVTVSESVKGDFSIDKPITVFNTNYLAIRDWLSHGAALDYTCDKSTHAIFLYSVSNEELKKHFRIAKTNETTIEEYAEQLTREALAFFEYDKKEIESLMQKKKAIYEIMYK